MMSHLRLYCEKSGQGPDVVLLHGWGLHSGIFDLLLPLLTPHFTVHCIDLPGFGRSPLPTAAYDVNLLVEQVSLVAPSRAIYMGWSLGGLVATALAVREPQRVTQLITVASNPCFIQKENWPHAMKPAVLDSFTQYLREDYEGTVIRFLGITTMGSETQKEDIKQLKDTVFMHGMPAGEALKGGLHILHAADVRDELHQIKMPFLRIYGRLDALVPVKVAEDVKAIVPHSEHWIFPKASHSPFMSHREEFSTRVVQWMQSHSFIAQ